MSLCPAFRHRLRSLWHQFFGTIALMEFVLKNRANSYALLVSLPANEAMHVPWHRVWKLWQVLAHSFSEQSYIDEIICPEKPVPTAVHFLGRSLPTKLCMSQRPTLQTQAIARGFPSVHDVHASLSLPPTGPLPKLFPTFSHPSTMPFISLPPNGPLPKLFPTFSHPSTMSTLPSRSQAIFPTFSRPSTMSTLPSCSLPTELSPSYFPQFPIRPRCPRFRLAPSERSSPQAMIFSHGFPSVVHTSISLLPMKLPPSYFPRFPVRPPCRCFHLVPSQPISHGFLSIHGGHASVSLPRNGALLIFATVSRPSALSSLPSRSLQALPEPRFPIRPRCPRFRLAPSQQTSPQAISRLFPSVHHVYASISLPPNGALPKLFPTASRPSTLSSLPSRSLPTGLSPSYFPRFPVRPLCRRFHLAPPSYFPRFRPSTLSSLPYRSPRGKVN